MHCANSHRKHPQDDAHEEEPRGKKLKPKGYKDLSPEIEDDDEDKAYPAGWPRKTRNPIEDRFLRMSEMVNFMLDAEAKDANRGEEEDEDEDEDGEEDNDEEDDGGAP